MNIPTFLAERVQNVQYTRIVAFGSSNTERRTVGMHWFDCFELACRNTWGRNTGCINSGHGGDSTIELLKRIEDECLAYRPHVAFITVGGNDSNPGREITPAVFRDNLRQIIQQMKACGCHLVLQTYYSLDLTEIPEERISKFFKMMQAVRDLSRETGCMLIDHLTRWERLRKSHPKLYLNLMEDAFHVNRIGNLLLGLDIVRAFSMELPNDPYFREARTLQALLDELADAETSKSETTCH